jgi:hypothetical protein
MTDGVIGWQMWFVIAIDPDYADDEGLYQHELTHVKQWAAVTLAAGVVLGLIYMPLDTYVRPLSTQPCIALYGVTV